MSRNTDNCAACNNPVTGAATVARDRKYHQDCFKCTTCGDVLTGEFFDKGGFPYCRKDYERRGGYTCGICKKLIEGTTIDDHEGGFYHDTCFACQKCNGSVVDGYFYVHGKRLCARCNAVNNVERAPTMKELGHCASCCKRFNAGEEYQEVKELRYHPNCLKCYYCKKVIDEAHEKYEYEQVTNILLNFCCQRCLSSGQPDRCHGCNKIIVVNPATSAFGKPYHTKCFKCSKCSREIKTSEPYVKDNNRAVCTNCHGK